MVFWSIKNRRYLVSGRPRGAPETIPKGGGLRPPPLGMVSGAPGAAQTPTIDDVYRPKNHVLKTLVQFLHDFRLPLQAGHVGQRTGEM